MDVSKKGGKIFIPGDLKVEGGLETIDLHAKGKVVIDGDLTITGEVKSTTPKEDKHEKIFYLGHPEVEGSWRFQVDEDGMLLIEKFENGEWFIKQSMI